MPPTHPRDRPREKRDAQHARNALATKALRFSMVSSTSRALASMPSKLARGLFSTQFPGPRPRQAVRSCNWRTQSKRRKRHKAFESNICAIDLSPEVGSTEPVECRWGCLISIDFRLCEHAPGAEPKAGAGVEPGFLQIFQAKSRFRSTKTGSCENGFLDLSFADTPSIPSPAC